MDFLYTNIGRGHPFYLDGIVQCMPADMTCNVTDVFELSSGLSALAWNSARALYRHGSSLGGPKSLYTRFRKNTDYRRRSALLNIMGHSLRKSLLRDPSLLVVAHPLLVSILRDKKNLFYQHGEMVAPQEALMGGTHHVLVPDGSVADRFIEAGLASEQLFVSGLCIEPALAEVAETAYAARLTRWTHAPDLTAALFSSGAEPRAHVRALTQAAISLVTSGARAILFAREGGAYEKFAQQAMSAKAVRPAIVPPGGTASPDLAEVTLCLYNSRQDLAHATRQFFPHMDCIVSPPHERTNWALGLGLPLFIVDPAIGTFAPLNRQLLLAQGVGQPLRARSFGTDLKSLLVDGGLAAMAQAGWGRYDIRGFARIAEYLEEEVDSSR